MRIIPGPVLILSLFVPLGLSTVAVFEPRVTTHVFIADTALLFWAFLDLILVARARVEIFRDAPRVVVRGETSRVFLTFSSSTPFPLHVRSLDDGLGNTANDQAFVLPSHSSRTIEYAIEPQARGTLVLEDHWIRYASPAGFWRRQDRIKARDEVRIIANPEVIPSEDAWDRLPRDVVAVLDFGPGLGQSSERCVEATMAFLRRCVGVGHRVGFVGIGKDVASALPPRAGKDALGRVVRCLGGMTSDISCPDLEEGTQELARLRGAFICFVTASTDSITEHRVVEALARIGLRNELIVAIIADPNIHALSLQRSAAGGYAAHLVARDEAFADRLGAKGISTLLVEPGELSDRFWKALESRTAIFRAESLRAPDDRPSHA